MTTVFAVLAVPAWLSLVVWICLVAFRGGFWRMDIRLPPVPPPGSISPAPAENGDDGERWPAVTIVVPARDEAEILPESFPTLLAQDYPGQLEIVLVDDASSDGTGDVARELAAASTRGEQVSVLRGQGPPPGWAGKVAAMDRGLRAAAPGGYVLFTDADIGHPPDSVRRLVAHAEAGGWDLVSLMARLNTRHRAERLIVPAFVYSFFQLYPPGWIRSGRRRTAGAAGGCMLVRRERLEQAGGLAPIASARIDDVALGHLLKLTGARTWLGVTRSVRSLRPYPGMAELWDMIARSAYTQLRCNPWLLAGTVLGLALTYGVPPLVGVAGAAADAWTAAVPALAAWALMTLSYLPVLRLYRLAPWRAPLLPGVMALYGAMTVDSARRHRRGRGGAWKGRVVESES
ncbi:glycosyltransferase [Actinospica durhamensis]|uniref:Glycosyltransferase n=1 Tax=Actinospica durhamensis TaxID=1508375 RepID=A0A941EYB5_9ACTN|nr:glycosyltransferase [Actinospica durhamensis]MBR7839663.1 glycosyltransferase [Actinospica durhamensis]